MNKKKAKGNFFKSRGFLLLIALIIFIIIITFFFGDSGIVEIIKTQKRIKQLTNNIALLEKKKEQLSEDINELKRNPLALEKAAREKLWLMKKNEKVIVIIKEDKNASSGN